MIDFGNLEEFQQSALTTGGNVAPALAAAFLLGPKAMQGLFYSFGAETFAAENHFGPVFSKQAAGESGFANTVRGGQTNARFTTGGGIFNKEALISFTDEAGDVFTRLDDGTLKAKEEEGNTSTDAVKTLTYTETIPVLLKAIQEQQALIEALQTKVAALEGE